MWQERKQRQLTELEELEKTGTQRSVLESPNHQETLVPPPHTTYHLLSLDLPGTTTVSPLAISSGYFPIFPKTKPKLLFSRNLKLRHCPLTSSLDISEDFCSITFHFPCLTPFNIILSQLLINHTSVILLLWLCKYFLVLSEVLYHHYI